MNKREFKCTEILIDLVENEGLVGIKTSFEDEGATFNEVLRLKEICNQAKTKVTLKIGGPEAVRDLKDSTIIGVKGLVAPMVESEFGLKKFILATKNHIPKDILSSLQLNVNLETTTAIKNSPEILNTPESDNLYGVTVGRVDLVSSMGKDRKYVNSDEVYNMAKKVFTHAKEKGLKACIGGAISIESLKFLKQLHSEGLLDKFETRYAIFDPSITLKNLSRALSKAQMFEYEWLMCKHETYLTSANQDLNRIKMIQDRINQSVSFK
jgi:4-hydroxy-2-oxoheptanedioate aldolase